MPDQEPRRNLCWKRVLVILAAQTPIVVRAQVAEFKIGHSKKQSAGLLSADCFFMKKLEEIICKEFNNIMLDSDVTLK